MLFGSSETLLTRHQKSTFRKKIYIIDSNSTHYFMMKNMKILVQEYHHPVRCLLKLRSYKSLTPDDNQDTQKCVRTMMSYSLSVNSVIVRYAFNCVSKSKYCIEDE